jgi:hypothetical protein
MKNEKSVLEHIPALTSRNGGGFTQAWALTRPALEVPAHRIWKRENEQKAKGMGTSQDGIDAMRV